MKSGKYKLTWMDAINAIKIMVFANILMVVIAAPEGRFPTWLELWHGFVSCCKYGIAPYLVNNFFTDEYKEARKMIDNENKPPQ